MQALELFFDESGSVEPNATEKIMVVAGAGVLAPSYDVLNDFHNKVYERLSAEGLLVGVCDRESRPAVSIGVPLDNLSKRTEVVTKACIQEHWDNVARAATLINTIACEMDVTIAAFSLTFPACVSDACRTVPEGVSVLLDRGYLSRFEDLLEFLFFESQFVTDALESGCELLINFPTRSSILNVGNHVENETLGTVLMKDWGQKNTWMVARGAKRMCDTLAPSSAPEILNAATSRRPTQWKSAMTKSLLRRCVCCKLLDWKNWKEMIDADNDRNGRQRENYSQFQVPPRQFHYFADFLCNGIFNAKQMTIQEIPPFSDWFLKGVMIDAVDSSVDVWLSALRTFANGDKSGALASIAKLDDRALQPANAAVLTKRTGSWSDQLSGSDLQRLFQLLENDLGKTEVAENATHIDEVSQMEARVNSEPVGCLIKEEPVDLQVLTKKPVRVRVEKPKKAWLGPVPLDGTIAYYPELAEEFDNSCPGWSSRPIEWEGNSTQGWWMRLYRLKGSRRTLPEAITLQEKQFSIKYFNTW